jgi:hypothetical protein
MSNQERSNENEIAAADFDLWACLGQRAPKPLLAHHSTSMNDMGAPSNDESEPPQVVRLGARFRKIG